MSKPPVTHRDWERERGRREQAAMQAVDAILDGMPDVAAIHAMKAREFEVNMKAISKALDAQDDAAS